MNLFNTVSQQCSRITTEHYSSSFSSAIRMLHKDLQPPIHNIYGFVRFADEIVDTFHDQDKRSLLQQFKNETFAAIERGLSLNPILHSFQLTVNDYKIDHSLIYAFFHSMEMDLNKQQYNKEAYNEYIYGSAEVVGLMCLYVFCEGNVASFNRLKPAAQSLGAAFQKVNFLRDVNADFHDLNRTYFPGVDFNRFDCDSKQQIEKDIESDFASAYKGIMKLPWKAKFGVYVAYKYYMSLFKKIKSAHPSVILHQRIRIPNYTKALILVKAGVKNRLKLI
jgi:phytoene/squalene synthetase